MLFFSIGSRADRARRAISRGLETAAHGSALGVSMARSSCLGRLPGTCGLMRGRTTGHPPEEPCKRLTAAIHNCCSLIKLRPSAGRWGCRESSGEVNWDVSVRGVIIESGGARTALRSRSMRSIAGVATSVWLAIRPGEPVKPDCRDGGQQIGSSLLRSRRQSLLN